MAKVSSKGILPPGQVPSKGMSVDSKGRLKWIDGMKPEPKTKLIVIPLPRHYRDGRASMEVNK